MAPARARGASTAGCCRARAIAGGCATPRIRRASSACISAPAARRRCSRIDASDFTSRVVALDDLWGTALWRLRERLLEAPTAGARLDRLEQHLLGLLQARWRTPDPAVAFACAEFARQPGLAAVECVRAATGWSRQRFIARFRDEVGLTPKRYCRVLRFGAALDALARDRRAPLAQLAIDGGYFDQAHFGNEFRRIAGITPRAYRPVAGDALHHVAEGKISKTGSASSVSLASLRS